MGGHSLKKEPSEEKGIQLQAREEVDLKRRGKFDHGHLRKFPQVIVVVIFLLASVFVGFRGAQATPQSEHEHPIDVYFENRTSGNTAFPAFFDNLSQTLAEVNSDNWSIYPENRYRIEVDPGTYDTTGSPEGGEANTFPLHVNFENTKILAVKDDTNVPQTDTSVTSLDAGDAGDAPVIEIGGSSIVLRGFSVKNGHTGICYNVHNNNIHSLKE